MDWTWHQKWKEQDFKDHNHFIWVSVDLAEYIALLIEETTNQT